MRRALILSFLIVFFCASSAECREDVKIFFVKGEPKIMRDGSDSWGLCKVDAIILNGDRIKTAKAEAVELSFSRKKMNVVRINEESDMFIRKTENPYSLELLNGKAMAFLEKLPKGSTFEIRTPVGISGARGTGWGVTAGEIQSIFKAFENFIYVKGIDASGNEIEGELVVRSGWESIVDKFNKPGALEKLTEADFTEWREWKEDLFKRLRDLKRMGFDEAGRMEEKIQWLEDSKNDFMDSRESFNDRRDGSSSSGGSSGGGPTSGPPY